MRTRHYVLFFLSVILIPSQSLGADAPAYRFVDIGAFDEAQESAASSISNNGTVLYADISQQSKGHRARVWYPGVKNPHEGTVVRPQFPDPPGFDFLDVNDRGQVLLLRSRRDKLNPGLSLWTPTVPGGAEGSIANVSAHFPDYSFEDTAMLLEDGSILASYLDRQRSYALPRIPTLLQPPSKGSERWTSMDVKHPLTGRSPESSPTAFNSSKIIVAAAVKLDAPNLWAPTGEGERWSLSYVGPQSTDPAGVGAFWCSAISDTGIIVGTAGYKAYAVYLDSTRRVIKSREIERLPALRGELRPKGVSDDGVVVGSVGFFKSFIWTEATGTLDLDSVTEGLPKEWQLEVGAMNPSGWIVGFAYTGSAPKPRGSGLKLPPRRACVLIPTKRQPEKP